MKLLKNSILFFFLLILFSGCATKIELSEYRDISSVNILDEDDVSKIYKTPIINLENIKVISTKYNKFILNDIIGAIHTSKIIKIKDSESSDYSIEINLDSVDLKASYTKRRWISTGKDRHGNLTGYYTNPYWTYRVYALIYAKVVDNKTKEIYAYSENGYYTFRTTGYNRRAIQSNEYKKAISDANKKLINAIANEIIPKARIISTKVNLDDDEDYIFLINMGLNHGVKSQQKSKVFKTIIEKDQINGKTIKNSIYIDDATVSNQVSSNNAWIVLDDEDNNKRIRVGDEVKVIFNN